MANQTIMSPVGRLVQGHPLDGKSNKQDGTPFISKATGQPYKEYFMALAVPKTDPALAEFMKTITDQTIADCPQGVPSRPNFNWKIIDGDSTTPDQSGNAPVSKEGFRGCMVFKFKTTIAPKVYSSVSGQLQQIVDLNFHKRGDWCRCQVSVAFNNSTQSPGIYLNMYGVQFIAYGEPIMSGADPACAFNDFAVGALPVGASMTPIAPAGPDPMAPVGYGAPAGFGAPAAPIGFGAPAAPIGYPAPAGYGAPMAPAGYGAPMAPAGYGAPMAPGAPAAPVGYPAPAAPMTPAYGFLNPQG